MRLALAEDSAILRLTLTEFLTGRGHTVDVSAADVPTLMAGLKSTPVDVVIMDVRMPPTFTNEGIIAALELRERTPGIGVLVLSQYIETFYASQLFAGQPDGLGYLLKDRVAEADQFLGALERVAAGDTVLDPEVLRRFIGASTKRDVMSTLTPREREVLELMAQGRTNTAIAHQLCVSLGTVEKYVTAIFSRLDLQQGHDDHRRVLAVLAFLGVTASTNL